MTGIIEEVFQEKRRQLLEFLKDNPKDEGWVTLILGNLNHLEGMLKDAIKKEYPRCPEFAKPFHRRMGCLVCDDIDPLIERIVGERHDCMNRPTE